MKIAKISKKIMSLFISAMMLMTSVPISLFSKVYVDGEYMTIQEIFDRGIAVEGKGYCSRPFEVLPGYKISKNAIPCPYLRGWYVEEVPAVKFLKDINNGNIRAGQVIGVYEYDNGHGVRGEGVGRDAFDIEYNKIPPTKDWRTKGFLDSEITRWDTKIERGSEVKVGHIEYKAPPMHLSDFTEEYAEQFWKNHPSAYYNPERLATVASADAERKAVLAYKGEDITETLLRQGYASEREEFAYVRNAIKLNGGEKINKAIAEEGDFLIIDMDGNSSLRRRYLWHEGEGVAVEKYQMVRLNTDVKINDEIVPRGSYILNHYGQYDVYTLTDMETKFLKVDEHLAEKIAAKHPAIRQKELAELIRHDKTGRFFGEVDTYAKFARVQAEQAKGGEEIVTKLADGLTETRNVAKPGDWIVKNPGGERYIVPGDKFAKKYEAAADLGEGWFKPTGKPQQFRQIKQDMVITASWGEKQVLRKGSFINVTDMNDLYGVAEKEFNDTFRTVKVLYKQNLTRIKSFVLKIEERLYAKYPRYQGVFFKRFFQNDVKYMKKQLEKRAARAAERNSSKKAASRTALRTFGGVAVGIGLYLGITLLTAPSVEAQNIQNRTRSEAIRELQADIANNAKKKDLFEKMQSYLDENYAVAVIADAINGEGVLLEEMGTVEPTIEATGLTEDELVEVIVDEAAEEEVRIPFIDPNLQNNPVYNLGSFQYHHN